MPFKPSVLFLSGLAGFAALTGVIVGCQSQPPAPLPSPSLEASPPASPSPKAVPFSPGKPNAGQTPPNPTSPNQPDNSTPPSSDATEATRTVEKCEISMVRVKDPNPPLNVRSSPNTDSSSNIVGQLQNGTYVSVEEEQSGWFRINEPTGWIAKSRTESNCNLKVERVELGRGQTSATIADRFVGTGSHEYRLNLAKGQQITVTSSKGVIPWVVAPDRKFLNEGGNESAWTGEVPTTGNYTLMLDSNYKGYAYSFTIKVQ